MKTELKKLKNSEVEIQFELTSEEFAKYLDKALLHLKDHVKMDGFRKGKVPASMVEEKVGQENLLMEAGDLAVKASYPKFVEEQKLEPIGEPEVQIKKIVPMPKKSAYGIPHTAESGIGTKEPAFIFTVKVAVLPEITLPDYKEIARHVKAKEISVDEKEIQDTLDYLQKSRAKFTTENRPAQAKDFVEIEYSTTALNAGKAIKDRFILGEGGFMKDFESNVIGMKAGEEKEFTAKFPGNTPRKDLAGKDAQFKVKMLSVQKMELAEVNDEFAKSLGAFDTLVALKENLKQGITMEKTESEKQKARGEILERITAETTFDTGAPFEKGARPSTQVLSAQVPEKMVGFEEARLLEDLKNQVMDRFSAQGGPALGWEQYLASVKKTEEEIKATFKVEAEKRIKNFLVLRQIGRAERIEVTPEELAEDLPKLMKNYTQEQLKQIDIGQLKEYSKGAIYNEKIFQELENL